MGLFKKIKDKLFGKSVAQSEKYVVALEKSRKIDNSISKVYL